jgi:uncharacterized protein YceH (UPF0502 family)
MELTHVEIRVLGCLVEKQATTPEVYPLSTNALRLACNQRSSRDPVVDYDEGTVTAALISLRERGLVRTVRGEGSRVYKHAHLLPEALGIDAEAVAVLSVLMLRGAQTSGELRARTERQHLFSVDEVEQTLERLGAREPSLARLLPRQPGQREARWTHLLGPAGAPQPEASLPQPEVSLPPPEASVSPPDEAPPGLAAEVAALRDELAELRARLEALEARE